MNPSLSKSSPFSHSSPMKFWFTSCGFNDLWNVPHVINLIIMDDKNNPDHPEWQWQITNSKCDHPFFRWSIEIDQLLCSEQVHILCVLQLFKCYVSKCDQSLFFWRWLKKRCARKLRQPLTNHKWQWKRFSDLVICDTVDNTWPQIRTLMKVRLTTETSTNLLLNIGNGRTIVAKISDPITIGVFLVLLQFGLLILPA